MIRFDRTVLTLILLTLSSGASAKDLAGITLAESNAVSYAAATEFASCYRRMSGRELPVRAGGPRAGWLHLRRGERVGAQLAENGALVVTGTERNDELYAVRRLLERRFGVRWFRAATDDDPGDCVPASVPRLAAFTDDYTPHFPIRRLDLTGVPPKVKPERELLFVDRLGFDTTPPIGGGQCMVQQAFAKTLYDEHPEYFALVDGKRTRSQLLCYSNPATGRHLLRHILSVYARTGGKGTYHFAQLDKVPGRCECAGCRAMDGSDDEHEGNASTRFLKFVTPVAAEIWKTYPEADLVAWAHSTYRKPPVGFRPDPRLKIWYFPHGRCYGHALDDPSCSRNVEFCDWLKGWTAVSPRVYLYNHMTCTPFLYGCVEEAEARDIALYRRLGVIGWKNEGGFPRLNECFASNWQWFHMVAELLRNPDQDGMTVVREAERLYYGAAYPAMAKYQALRRELWKKSDACVGYPFGDPRRPVLLDEPGAKEKLLGYLDEAEAAVEVKSESEKVKSAEFAILKSRVGCDRRWLEEHWVKPNEHQRELRRHALAVPRTDAWQAAQVSGFRFPARRTDTAVPETLATTASFRHDGTDLRVRIVAREPSPEKMRTSRPVDPAWMDDGIELMLEPPNSPNEHLQIVVSARGKTYASLQPRGAVTDVGVRATGRVLADRYEIDLSVPLADLRRLGELGKPWKFLLGRTRHVDDAVTPKGAIMSNTGGYFHDAASYYPLTFGE